MKTITIELRVDFELEGRDSKEVAIVEAARQAAKHLYSTALLLQDKRKPQIVLMAGDMIEGDKEIELAEDVL